MTLPLVLLASFGHAEPAAAPASTASPPAPVSAGCPFAETPAAAPLPLLFGRVLVDADPANGQVLSGYRSMGTDPHAVVPLDASKDVVRWTYPDGSAAVIAVEEPLRYADADLGPAVAEVLQRRVGTDGTAGFAAAPLLPTAPKVRAQALAGPIPGAGWLESVAYAFPDGAEIDATIVLFGPIAEDAVCRAAAATRLAAVRPGVRPRDQGGKPIDWPVPTGGTLHLAIPAGYAWEVDVGWEFTVYRAKRWAHLGEPMEGFEIVTSIAPDPLPTFDTSALAKATVLGEPAEWRSVAPDREEAWARGILGAERGGTIRLVVTATKPGARARLRRWVQRARFEPGAAPPDAPIRTYQMTLPDDDVPEEQAAPPPAPKDGEAPRP